jgi:hypothetical protein
VKDAFTRFRYASTGRWAVSIRTYSAIIFPFGFLTSIEREQLFNTIGIAQAATIAFAGEIAACLYIYILQATLLRGRYEQLQPLRRCAFVWVSAGVVRGFFTACYVFWVYGFALNFSSRILPSTFYTAFTMMLAAFYFGTIERKRIEIQAMNSLGKVLSQEQKELSSIQKDLSSQFSEVLDKELLPQAEGLRDLVSQALTLQPQSENNHIFEELQIKSNQLSSALEVQLKKFIGAKSKINTEPFEEAQFSYWFALIPRTVSIRLTFILLLLGSASGQFPRNGLGGVLSGILATFIIVAYLLPFSFLFKRTNFSRVILLTASFGGVFLLQYFYVIMQSTVLTSLERPFEPWYAGLKTMYGVYLASVIASLMIQIGYSHKGVVEGSLNLQKGIQSLTKNNSGLESSNFEARYGVLQGKITGVTIALHLLNSKSLGEISESRKQELLFNANSLLTQSIASIKNLEALS